MPRSPRQGPAAWPLVLALLLSLTALITLVWLRNSIIREEKSQLAIAQRVFESAGALPRLEEDAVLFHQVEAIAESLERNELVRELYVTKATRRRGQVLIRPFYLELTQPDWEERVAGWERLPIGDDQAPLGWIYVHLSRANRKAVDRTILLFSGFLVVCLGMIVFRQRGKEQELRRTVYELEQRKAEIIQLERLALAGQLSANIFHDIRKPVLNIKHEVADALAEDFPGGRDPIPSFRSIGDQTDLFLNMLRELGFEQFVRAKDDEGEFCDPVEIIDRALSLVRYERDNVQVHLDVREQPALPLLFAPPYRLIQLLSNLILNSYQAMDGKGNLYIDIWGETWGEDGEALQIAIEDTGPGIAPELRDNLFRPFTTTRSDRGGSGLGLYICWMIVQDLSGEIAVEEGLRGGGARFQLSIPSAQGPKDAP